MIPATVPSIFWTDFSLSGLMFPAGSVLTTVLASIQRSTGFSCLFYGGPGTGKTETVYQLARQSGRDLFVVDVAQIKSCWVGESEKNIKRVFSRYRECVKNGGTIPILLFNQLGGLQPVTGLSLKLNF